MKVGDLVRIANDPSHRLFGYGLVIDQTTTNLGMRTKVQWLRYKAREFSQEQEDKAIAYLVKNLFESLRIPKDYLKESEE